MKKTNISSFTPFSSLEEGVPTAHLFDLSSCSFSELFNERNALEALKGLREYLLSLSLGVIEVDLPSGVFLENPELISIGSETKVEPGSTIIGPCVIGKKCEVRQGAYIRGDVLTGDHVVIGHATEAKEAIFLSHAKAGHFAYVGNSILGANTNLGAGTKCANLRFDNQEVLIRRGKETFKSGMRKLGALLGDGAQTGCNSVTSPGTVVEKKGVILPCAHVKGWIESKSF